MDVVLDPEEVDFLADVLNSYRSDLRMEIVDTDSAPYRRTLVADRDRVDRILAKLGRPAT